MTNESGAQMDYSSILRSLDAMTLIKEGGFLAALVVLLFAFIVVVVLLWNNIKHSQEVQSSLNNRVQAIEAALKENTDIEQQILNEIAKLHGVFVGLGLRNHMEEGNG